MTHHFISRRKWKVTNRNPGFIFKEFLNLFILTTLHVAKIKGKDTFSYEMVSLSPVCEELS
ncbi:MAG: hypothetical protein COV66_15015 [Nitrospinae bacterium CG11_big_fil_rev_8_21_14_0_20_45_15]|nr:MAG: hypothetical protein COV66_15015 [Nitrospinae bacterium CG11_big_fil_rev_8_21_14_0_20_45_15]